MSVEATAIDDAETWDALVDRAGGATPFHRYAALEVFADHTDTTLHPLVARKGQEPIGLFPVFELSRGPITAAFSPPPSRKISYLGPLTLLDPNAKQRRRERSHANFVESALAYVDREISPRYVNVRTPPGYDDPRPMLWNEFDATPRYTYHLDLTRDPDDLLAAASSDLRSNVTGTDRDAFEIRTGDREGLHRIVREAQERHAEQGVSYGVTSPFVRDLSRALPEAMTAYVCTVDDEFVGGTITLADEETVYRWQSVVDFEAPVPAQDLLDWHVVEAGHEAGRERYDLVGANDRRLCGYKAKFAPDVATHYELQRSGPLMDLAAGAYRRLR